MVSDVWQRDRSMRLQFLSKTTLNCLRIPHKVWKEIPQLGGTITFFGQLLTTPKKRRRRRSSFKMWLAMWTCAQAVRFSTIQRRRRRSFKVWLVMCTFAQTVGFSTMQRRRSRRRRRRNNNNKNFPTVACTVGQKSKLSGFPQYNEE